MLIRLPWRREKRRSRQELASHVYSYPPEYYDSYGNYYHHNYYAYDSEHYGLTSYEQQPPPQEVERPYYVQHYSQHVVQYDTRAPTGIQGLDEWLGGGLRRGETYLIAGETGTGKTIFGIQFLKHGSDLGETGIYITIDEPSDDVKRGVRESLGWDLEAYELSGRLVILDFRTYFRVYDKEGSISLDPRDLAKTIAEYVGKYNAKRLVIDPIAPLVITSHRDVLWIREYLRELIFQLKKIKDITTIMTSEIPTGETNKMSRFGVEEYLAGGVIKLSLEEHGGKLHRVMFIRKMRWMPLEPLKLVFEIHTYHGIVVKGLFNDYVKRSKW